MSSSLDVTAISLEAKSVGIKEATQSLGGLSSSAANAEKRVQALNAATEKMNTINVASVTAMNSYISKLQQQASIMQTLRTGSTGAAASTQALAAAMTLLAASMNTLSQRTNQAEVSQRRHNAGMRDAHDLARGLSGSLGALWLTYGNILPMLAGVALGASLKEAVTGFTAVEYQMTMVKALTEDTKNSVKGLTEQMHEVSVALGISPEAAAKGLRALAQAGLDTKAALETLPVAFKLATVGELPLEQAALAMTGVMNAYGLAVRDLEHIGDMMSKAGAMSAASVDSISVSMKYSAGTAEQYGVSLEKLGTILTLLGKRGITGSSAGVAANNLIAEIYSPSSDKAIRAMAALGVNAYADGVRKEFDVVTAEMKSALTKFDAQSQGKLLEDMFGKKGGKGFYAIAKAGQEEFLAIEKELVGATGFTAEVYKQSLQTIQGQMNLTKAAITNMFAQVGEESSAPIKALLSVVRDIASTDGVKDAFVGLSQSIKTFVTTVVPAAAAVGGLWLAMRVGPPVIMAVTAAMSLFSAAGFAAAYSRVGVAVAGLIGAFQAGSLAMLAANPIVIGLVGVVTLLAGAYFLLKRDKESALSLHETEMKNSVDTQKNLKDEIDLIDRKIKLQRRGVSADAEAAELRKMANQDALTMMQGEVENSDKKINALTKQGPSRTDGAELARQTMISTLTAGNKALKDALKEKEVSFGKEAELDAKRLDRLKVYREEQRLLRLGEELAEEGQETATVGNGKYGKDPKGAAAAASDAYTAALTKHADDIRASKTAMQNFEDTQNNLFRAGEIGKLKVIQEVGNKQVEELDKQRDAIQAQLTIAQGKKNGQADVANFSGDLAANAVAAKSAKIKLAEETNVQLAKYEEDATRFRITQLEIQGKYGEAAALRFSSDNKMAFKQAEQDLADFGNTFPIITERYAQMKAAQADAISKGYSKEASNAFLDEAERVRNSLKGIQTASEGLGLGAMLSAAAAASKELADSMPKMEALKGGITDPTQLNEANAQLINLAENQRKLWAGVGESISRSLGDAFGNAGKAAGDLLMVSINTGNVETKLAADKAAAIRSTEAAHKEFGFSQFDTAKAIGKINIDYANKEKSTRIKSYGDMAGAAKGFFKEGSKGYKVLEGAEKAFRAMELFNIGKSLVASLFATTAKTTAVVGAQGVETAAVGAGEMARNLLKIPGVIMSFMSSLGPWGAAAAAVAIAAVLGGAFSGGGGGGQSAADRQKKAGTGTVFGDSNAKSDSIAKSIEIMEKNSGLGLVHSDGMLRSLRNIEASMVGFSNILIRTGSTKTNITGSAGSAASFTEGLGSKLTLTSILDSFTNGWVGKMSGKISNAVFGGKVSVQDHGIMAGPTTYGQVDAGGLSVNKFTRTKKDGGWFRSDKYSDNPESLGKQATDQFSLIITSLGDGVKSAAKELGIGEAEFAKKLDAMKINFGKISFKDLSTEEIQEQFSAIFSSLGDEMALLAFPELTKFSQNAEGYLETFARVANGVMQVKDVFAVLGKSFELTGYAAAIVSDNLIKAAGSVEALTEGTKYFVDNFLTEAERMAPITASVNKRLAELNLSELTSIELFTKKVRALDLTNASEQVLYTDLLALAPAFKEAADYAQELAEGTVSLTKAQQKALDAVEKAKSNLQEAYDKERDSLQGVIDKTKAFIGTLKSYQDGLKLGADSPLTNMQKYAEAHKQFDATAAAANGGDQVAKDKFTGAASALLAASKTINASGDGYTSDFNMVQNMIDTLMGSATSQVDVATASLNALNAQVLGLIDVNTSVMSVTQAITELQKAITLGGIAGLTNKQMDTTYTPTPAQVAAATPVGTPANQIAPAVPLIVKGLEIIGNKLDALRTEQAAQTGAQIQATHAAAETNAEDTVDGLEGLSSMIGRITKKIALA